MSKNNLPVIGKSDMIEAAKTDGYWTKTDRWDYLQVACRMIQNIPHAVCVLEIGPGTLPVVKNSDTMDIQQWGKKPPKFLHDATVIPWPFKDKSYDIAVALQVWEHLGNKQTIAFNELRRVARFAVLSVPNNWPGKGSHSGITLNTVRKWIGKTRILEHIVVGKKFPRLVMLFDLS
jgi:hypothetical protein